MATVLTPSFSESIYATSPPSLRESYAAYPPSFSESIYATYPNESQRSSGCAVAGVVLFIVVIALIVWLIVIFASPGSSGGGGGNGFLLKTDYNPMDGVAVVSSKECGHCSAAMPAIKKAAKKSSAKFSVVDADDAQSAAFMTRHSVTGVPTILKMKDGKVTELYAGDRSAKSIAAFASS